MFFWLISMVNSLKAHLKTSPLTRSLYLAVANYAGGVRNRRKIKGRSLEDIFSDYYRENFWGSDESVSGGGSTLEYTENLRRELPALIERYGVTSILDAPCGDFNWFQYVKLPTGVSYTGADIVPDLIKSNNEKFGNSDRTFQVLDITRDPLPRSDLWICRDVLFHLCTKDVFSVIHNFVNSDIKYLLTTSNVLCTENKDILSGQFRQINLQIDPFNFPAPLFSIDDWIEGDPVRKMCLWDRETISALMRRTSSNTRS